MSIKKILKFGGSSVATPDRVREVASIVREAATSGRVVVVVSAFQGVTNQLLESARLAETGDERFLSLHQQLVDRHLHTLSALHGNRPPKRVAAECQGILSELRDVLQGIFLLRHSPPRALDLVASAGERLSAIVLASFLQRSVPSRFVDARDVVVTDDQFTRAAVLHEKTNAAIARRFAKIFRDARGPVIPVVTGFIGATEDGQTTTIGRNGSDYSAAIFGAALNASVIEIWTDVDGILSADPGAVKSAFVVPHMSYEEAMELSYFGAKVLHASTIAPAVTKRIPVVIKNTLNRKAPGTRISGRIDRWDSVAKGIASIDECALLTLRGLSMVGVPGTARRLFEALASNDISVVMISQASSEHTICFAVHTADVEAARNAVREEFRYEFHAKLTSLDETLNQTIVAVVGDGMQGTPGVSGKIFQALGRSRVNVSAIAQGASERNVSLVIDAGQKRRALNVIHEAFFGQKKRLGVVLVGTGNIGSALLRQLHQQRSYLLAKGFDVRVCAIANSKRLLCSSEGIDLVRWKEELNAASARMNTRELLRQVAAMELANAVFIDCTASEEIVGIYEDAVRLDLHIVTPNKKANVLPWERYRRLMKLLKDRQRQFLYEANVGAGLPIISTLQDLIASGDQVVRIEGIFSGTLSHLFNHYTGAQPFSGLVQEAMELGYTEADPREDLTGDDVARKLLILARQLGLQMEMKDIRAENLVPPALRGGAMRNDFFRKFSRFDPVMERRLQEAKRHDAVLRYVGVLQGRAAFSGIREIPADHLFASAKGSDNIIAFTTHRYSRTPLVIQGPGAGADVTAMGVFSDLLKLLNSMPE